MSQPSMILATSSYDRTIRFWQTLTGDCIHTIEYHDLNVNKLEITPDKTRLAAACNPFIQFYDLVYSTNYCQFMTTYKSHTGNVTALEFQCDTKMMYSGSEDKTVKIWDLRTNCCEKEYENESAVNTLVLHPNQTELISGDQNGNIRVWDLRKDSCSCELVPEADTAVRSLTVMQDGTMVVAANNRGTCYVWRLLHGNQMMTEFEPLHKLQAHNGHILKCLFSPENKYLATTSSDKTVKIWNVNDGFKLEKVLTGHKRWVWDCDFSKDGEFLVTASSDVTARLWSMASGNEVKVYNGHHKPIVCSALLN